MINKRVNMREAMFGAGCFWGVQAMFDDVDGVVETEVGFAGGHPSASSGQVHPPTYKEVCTDTTGHAEVVHIWYDPEIVSYEKLLKAFWNEHDPTTINGQGPDIGSQYRSIIFYYDDEQKKLAEKSKKDLAESGKYSDFIVTEITEAMPFYRAEEHHQKYFEKTGRKIC